MAEKDTSPTTSDQNQKRQSYINWDEYFMAVAFLSAKRSKDPRTQVGACIVNNEKKIVGIGYNGMPNGCGDDTFPWCRKSEDPLMSKYLYVCHAEVNAILNKNSSDVKNCTIYVGLFPCNECAKVIIQSGIRNVIYISDKHAHKIETKAAKKMFDAAGVEYRYFHSLNHIKCLSLLNWYKCQNVLGDYTNGLHRLTQLVFLNFYNFNICSQCCTCDNCVIFSSSYSRQYNPPSEKLEIIFTETNGNDMTQLPPTPLKNSF